MFKKLKLFFIVAFSLAFSNSNSQTVDLNLTPEVSNQIAEERKMLDDLKNEICTKVDEFTGDVTAASGGALAYSSWVRFCSDRRGYRWAE